MQRVPKRAGDQLRTAATIDKAVRLLGYAPSVTPETGLARQVEWMKALLAEV
jgi:nucleoside-diphosphate-sugar epimerase